MLKTRPLSLSVIQMKALAKPRLNKLAELFTRGDAVWRSSISSSSESLLTTRHGVTQQRKSPLGDSALFKLSTALKDIGHVLEFSA